MFKNTTYKTKHFWDDITNTAMWETLATISWQRSTIRQLSRNRKGSGVHSKIFSNTVEQKNLRITAKEEREHSFLLSESSQPQRRYYSAPRGNFPAKMSSVCQERESGWATSFSSFSGHHMKVLLRFHPTQTSKAEMFNWKKEEKQGLPIERMQRGRSWLTLRYTSPSYLTQSELSEHR